MERRGPRTSIAGPTGPANSTKERPELIGRQSLQLTSPDDRSVHRTSLVKAGGEGRLISLELATAAEGGEINLMAAEERLAVVISGAAAVEVERVELGEAARAGDLFDTPGDAIYLPPGTGATLTAVGGAAELALVSAPAGDWAPGPARLIAAGDQRSVQAGRESWRRTVRTILGPEQPASRLLVGETISPTGLWSSYPPHRHDRDSPEEARLEELYWFRFRPREGFGALLRYSEGEERHARMVVDGEAAVIPSGFHPVVAAPGYELYYLWVLAGERREQRVYLDPRHRWVEETR